MDATYVLAKAGHVNPLPRAEAIGLAIGRQSVVRAPTAVIRPPRCASSPRRASRSFAPFQVPRTRRCLIRYHNIQSYTAAAYFPARRPHLKMESQEQLANIRNNYNHIIAQVNIALRAYVGDAPRLLQQPNTTSSRPVSPGLSPTSMMPNTNLQILLKILISPSSSPFAPAREVGLRNTSTRPSSATPYKSAAPHGSRKSSTVLHDMSAVKLCVMALSSPQPPSSVP
ncbi:hypothetical protein OH76DRAFT_193890 [Lentinus brumalis]|uniref:Uncharacterized protein n=1 Tax=Lentinus brumalis TaxID=2498619 RepID=A0A371DHY6_9APHY|nr:hypothetical protein OH76DRAFT_193890 [Polyporus brumalis]